MIDEEWAMCPVQQIDLHEPRKMAIYEICFSITRKVAIRIVENEYFTIRLKSNTEGDKMMEHDRATQKMATFCKFARIYMMHKF